MPLIIEIMYSVKVKKYLIPSLTRRCVKPMLTRYTAFWTINQFELVFRSNKWFYLMDCFITQLNVCVNNLLFIIKLIFFRPRTSARCQIKANEQEFPPNFTSTDSLMDEELEKWQLIDFSVGKTNFLEADSISLTSRMTLTKVFDHFEQVISVLSSSELSKP